MSGVVHLRVETADADRRGPYGFGPVQRVAYAVDDGPVQQTEDLGALCALLMDADVVCGHNVLGFDLAALEAHHGLDLGALVAGGRVRDTLIIARQMWPPRSGDGEHRATDGVGYSLEDCARRLGLGGAGSGVELSRQVSLHPGMPMSEYLFREHQVLWRLSWITRAGFLVDVPALDGLIAHQERCRAAVRAAFARRHGLWEGSSSPHSTNKGKAAIEAEMVRLGVEPPRKDNGALATSKNALDKLQARYPGNDRLTALCEEIDVLNGTQASTLMELRASVRSDGRVHPHLEANLSTGRFSDTDPRLSGLGKRTRRGLLERSVLLPDPGDVLLTVDLSQIDARAVAAMSQDRYYMAAFARGKDLYREVATHVTYDPGDRALGKVLSLAMNYGMGAESLAEESGLTVEMASAVLTDVAVRYSRVDAFKSRARRAATMSGVIVTPQGRHVAVPQGDGAYTKAPAALGQSTARDLLMEGILRLPLGALPRLRAVIHDEIVLSVPEEHYERCRDDVLAALQFEFAPPTSWMPSDMREDIRPLPILAASGEAGADWADCYREDKSSWPEVAAEHRALPSCEDAACAWHGPGGLGPDAPELPAGAAPAVPVVETKEH